MSPGGLSCSGCTKSSSASLLKCSGCSQAYYCNNLCQRNHWKIHKKSVSVKTNGSSVIFIFLKLSKFSVNLSKLKVWREKEWAW